jgi:hypothetical protein
MFVAALLGGSFVPQILLSPRHGPRGVGLDDHEHLHPHGDHRQKQSDRSER